MNRILIVRTDRIGDVVLSTPVVKAVRLAFPDSFIAMMVSPYAREIVDGNPYLNEVIAFDKNKFKGIPGSLKFSQRLKKKAFDIALVLHPTKRVHLLLWLAGIKKRIGFDKKCSFLLTQKIPHTKQMGQKHEAEYNMEVLKAAGIDTGSRVEGAGYRELFVPVKDENRLKIGNILRDNGFTDKDDFVVIHPCASCPSKRWPAGRFAQVADEIINKLHKRIVVIASVNDKQFGEEIGEKAENEILDLSGVLSVGELIALLERASLLISNDSGPVHIAVALKVPVVAIFGRNQPGLSARRWGPLGEKDIVLHKDVGCLECLAHDCKVGFKCLMAIEPGEVISAAERLLKINR